MQKGVWMGNLCFCLRIAVVKLYPLYTTILFFKHHLIVLIVALTVAMYNYKKKWSQLHHNKILPVC